MSSSVSADNNPSNNPSSSSHIVGRVIPPKSGLGMFRRFMANQLDDTMVLPPKSGLDCIRPVVPTFVDLNFRPLRPKDYEPKRAHSRSGNSIAGSSHLSSSTKEVVDLGERFHKKQGVNLHQRGGVGQHRHDCTGAPTTVDETIYSSEMEDDCEGGCAVDRFKGNPDGKHLAQSKDGDCDSNNHDEHAQEPPACSAAASTATNSTSLRFSKARRHNRRLARGSAILHSQAQVRAANGPEQGREQLQSHGQWERLHMHDKVRLFIVVEPGVTEPDSGSGVYLCWIDFGGRLHHFSELKEGKPHEEPSFVGRTFMVVTLPNDNSTRKPSTIKDLDLNTQVLLTYTCKHAPSRDGGLVHFVHVKPSGEASWMALRPDGSDPFSGYDDSQSPLDEALTQSGWTGYEDVKLGLTKGKHGKLITQDDNNENSNNNNETNNEHKLRFKTINKLASDELSHVFTISGRAILNPALRGDATIDCADTLRSAGEYRLGWCSDMQHSSGDQEMLIRFVVKRDGSPLPPGVGLFVCWVDPEGRLRESHYRELTKKRAHDEYSFKGRRFLILKLGANEKHPTNIYEVHPQTQALWLYYAKEAPHPELMHVVTFRLDDGTGSFMTTARDPDELRICVGCTTPRCMMTSDQWLPRSGPVELPSSDQMWTLEHMFACPPLPPADFDSYHETLYVWGDVDFDAYGPRGCFPLYKYLMNQIVPQVMIGRCLCNNDPATYQPIWGEFKTWVVQAQYYWQDEQGEGQGSHALCGAAVDVIPGEFISTRIAYNPIDGSLDVSIGPSVRQNNGTWEDVKDRRSHIISTRPFPNSSPPLFATWSELFDQALINSRQDCPEISLLCRPELNIEYKGSVRLETLAALCPFNVAAPKVNGVRLDTKARLYSPSMTAQDLQNALPASTVVYFDS